jgi:hypothetical protein
VSTSEKQTTTSQQSQSQTNPWAPQAAALTDAFGKAQDAYAKSSQAVAPTDFTAGFNPQQLATFQAMIGQGSNMAVPSTQAGAAGALTGAGVSGTQGALSGFAGFDPTASNNTQSIVDSANKYASGQNIDAQVNDAMLNARQTARDVTLPGINQSAAISGNTNSSRTGIAEGLVERGLAQQSANLGASLRSQAFQNGLTLAQQQAQSNKASRLAALGGQGALGASAVSGGNTAGNSSVANTGALDTLAMTGGAGLQAADQAALTNQLQRYQFDTQSPYANLTELMKIIGSGNWGSSTTSSGTGTSTEKSTPSTLSTIGGGIGALTSIMGMFGGGALAAGEVGGSIGGSTSSIGYGGLNVPRFGF